MKLKKEIENIIDEWFNIHENFIKKSTSSNYKNILNNHILRDFYTEKFYSLNNKKLQEYILHKIKNGSVKKGELSSKTVKDIIVVLKLILRFSFEQGYLDSFDLTVRYPKEQKYQKPRTIKQKHLELIVDSIKESNDVRTIGILFGLYSGLRIGEVCALKRSDIDLESNMITIRRTLQRIYNKDDKSFLIETTPKTVASNRQVPLSKIIRKYLEHSECKENDYVISKGPRPVEPRVLREVFNRLLLKNNLPHYKFHSLRHTFATKCIEIDIDYKTVSSLMGHKDVTTTLNLYVHPNINHKEKAIRKLTASFSV